MTRRYQTAVRLLRLSLLVLALSPLTAPFSTVEISDLFGEKRHAGEAIFQWKSAPGHSAADLDSSQWEPAPLTTFAIVFACFLFVARPRRTHSIPLRI